MPENQSGQKKIMSTKPQKYNQTMEHAMVFKAPDEMKAKIHHIADKENTKASELIRAWLEIFIEDYEKEESALRHMSTKTYDGSRFS